MKIRAGTSGYSYKEWKGPFYPPRIKPAEMLEYYAQRLSTVEINSSFYRMPRRDVLDTWRQRVPPAFRFAIKASRRITHRKPMQDSAEPLAYLLDNLAVLGPALGCVLFQFPPYLRADQELLGGFLAQLPSGLRCAFEFRHASWFEQETCRALTEVNAALVASDTDEAPLEALQSTADWGYLRLRRSDYSDRDLKRWRDRIASQPWARAYVYFKHEDEGAGPALAGRFMQIAGVSEPLTGAHAS